MSKVKIQGSASGTGTLTIQAPTTSTDRTLNLPDSTDTLAVNSDVTNKLPLAGGNLTGAVSLTGGDLVIDQTNNGYSGLRIHDDSGADYNSYIDLGRNQGGTRLSIRKGGRAQGTSPWQNATPDVIVSFANEGIAFHGDTAAANTLDDYEEGTFTPTFIGDTNPTVSYHEKEGYYTKIGNMVYIRLWMRTSAVSNTGTSTLYIGGLPFNVKFGNSQKGGVTKGHIQNWGTIPENLFFYDNSNSIYFWDETNGTTHRTNILTNGSDKNQISCEGFYEVA
jgi:hypothetical protein